MTERWRGWYPRLGALAALLALAACGDDGNGGNEPPPPTEFTLEAGGNNVPNRYSSDLWVHGSYAYTGTWGGWRGTAPSATW